MNMTSLIEVKSNPKIPKIAPGDTVKVSVKVVEGEKERIQVFQGVVMGVKRGASGGSFTVRRVTYGVGVERTFLLNSPLVAKVEVVRHGKVRRAKLYYLRGLSGKASRIKERRVTGEEELVPEEPVTAEPEAVVEEKKTTEEKAVAGEKVVAATQPVAEEKTVAEAKAVVKDKVVAADTAVTEEKAKPEPKKS